MVITARCIIQRRQAWFQKGIVLIYYVVVPSVSIFYLIADRGLDWATFYCELFSIGPTSDITITPAVIDANADIFDDAAATNPSIRLIVRSHDAVRYVTPDVNDDIVYSPDGQTELHGRVLTIYCLALNILQQHRLCAFLDVALRTTLPTTKETQWTNDFLPVLAQLHQEASIYF